MFSYFRWIVYNNGVGASLLLNLCTIPSLKRTLIKHNYHQLIMSFPSQSLNMKLFFPRGNKYKWSREFLLILKQFYQTNFHKQFLFGKKKKRFWEREREIFFIECNRLRAHFHIYIYNTEREITSTCLRGQTYAWRQMRAHLMAEKCSEWLSFAHPKKRIVNQIQKLNYAVDSKHHLLKR